MVIFILQQSEDHVLKKLLSTAQSNWPNETYSNSVTEAAKRINGNEFDILIASQLEAEQILSGECKLERASTIFLPSILKHLARKKSYESQL